MQKSRNVLLSISIIGLLALLIASCSKNEPTMSSDIFSNVTSKESSMSFSSEDSLESKDVTVETGSSVSKVSQNIQGSSQNSTSVNIGNSSVKSSQTTVSNTSSYTASVSDQPAGNQQNLANTMLKLIKDKKMTVGFIGGSVTEGTGASSIENGWRRKTVKWMKEIYPQAEIEEVRASMGGMGSYYGLMRADESLLSKNPDLVFIEFAINDSYLSYTKEDSTRYMESLVRKCYESNPNMDIVLVYTTDRNKKGDSTIWIQGFNTVADHYGLITIDAGAFMKEKIGQNNWITYFSDSAHPNDKGHDLIFQIVSKTIESELKAVGTVNSLQKHTIPSAMGKNLLLKTKMIHSAAIKEENPDLTALGTSYAAPNGAIKLSPGQSMKITFTGKTVGVYWDRGPKFSNEVKCTVDNQSPVTKDLSTQSSGSYQYILFDNLADTQHILTISNEGKLPVQLNEIFVSE